jgi:hypothetical protein
MKEFLAYRDETGRFKFFRTADIVKQWEGPPPARTTLYELRSGLFVLVDPPQEGRPGKGRTVGSDEAVALLTVWGEELTPKLLMVALCNPPALPGQWTSPRKARHFPLSEVPDDFDPEDEVYEYGITRDLYSQPDGTWILVSERYHRLTGCRYGKQSETVPPAEARRLLETDGLEPPTELWRGEETDEPETNQPSVVVDAPPKPPAPTPHEDIPSTKENRRVQQARVKDEAR